MSKLYIFGIGGTGSRVLRSLTMLLASGVECKGVDTVVPIVIDRDMSNHDLMRTKLLIDDYIEVNKTALKTGKNKFFRTKIELLNNELCLQLKDRTLKFDEYIGKDSMGKNNKALMEMLFSKKTLELDMSAGFQGNPNIGSMVLNQFDDSDIFKAFAKDFTDPNNKIFIISSIFGGTGASGFPLLRKVLHTIKEKKDTNQLDNWGLVNEACIGAISVLPYFIVKHATDDSLVDSDTFTDKAKAALAYYKTEDGHLDTFYYIGDTHPTAYDHHKGGDGQKNKAHFVELAAAMAILDFVDPEKAAGNIHRDSNKKIVETAYKEFGILPDKENENCFDIKFSNLADETKKMLVNPLSRFFLFGKYIEEIFGKQNKYQPYACKTFDEQFVHNNFMQKLKAVQSAFFEWLQEMDWQNRKFSPFNLSSTDAFNAVRGDINIVRKANRFDALKYKNWARVDNELNRQSAKIKKSVINGERFLELFYNTTKSLIEYKNN
jgi:hypothetical protein